MLQKFITAYRPNTNCTIATPEIVEEYKNKIPDVLLYLWKNHGFGKYRNGLIEIVSPKDFEPTLWTWLGKEVKNYVPFAITAFGELIYYRKLTKTDEDICIVDIQYRKVEVLTWNAEEFFTDFLLEKEMRDEWLREKLFNEIIKKEKTALKKHEIFTFTPVFAMGGSEDIKFLKRGNAQVYQDLVFQITM